MRALILAASLAATLGAAAPAISGETGRVVLDPAKGHSLEIGSGKAVGYYLAKDGNCKLTLTFAPKGNTEGVKGAGTRVSFLVAPGDKGMVESPEGKSVMFFCERDAKHMSVVPFKRIAYVAPKAS